MPPYSPSYLKRKNNGGYMPARKRPMMVRKTFKNYPVYNTVTTAPAPTRVELKYDIGQVVATLGNAGSVSLLSTIANGSGSSERIGKRIRFHDIEIIWEMTLAASHSLAHHKVWIVYDNSPNGILPNFTDIFTSQNAFTLANADTKGRFKILQEHRISSQDATASGFARCWFSNVSGHKVTSLKGKTAQFLGTTDSIADIEKGAIYVCYISDLTAVVTLNLQNKIQYSDA